MSGFIGGGTMIYAGGGFLPGPTASPVVPDLVTVAGLGALLGGANTVGVGGWNNGSTGPAGSIGSITSGAVPTFLLPTVGSPIAGIGDAKPTSDFGAVAGFEFNVFGALPQNAFSSLQIIELGVTLLTAAAVNFTNGGGCGPDTIWQWALQGLVSGHTYSYKFNP